MRVLTVTFSAAANGRQLTLDRDSLLHSISAKVSSCVVSYDSAATIANRLTAPADEVQSKDIFVGGTGTGGTSQTLILIPLTKDEAIFLSAGAAGAIQLFFEDLPELS